MKHIVLGTLLSIIVTCARADLSATDCRNAFGTAVPACTEWTFSQSGNYNLCGCAECKDGYYKTGSTRSYNNLKLTNECAKGTDSGTGTGKPTVSTCPSGYSLCTSGQCHGPSTTIDGVIWCGNLDNGVSVCTAKPAYVASAYFMSNCCKNGAYTAANSTSKCVFLSCVTGMTMNNGGCVCAKGYYGTASGGCKECPSSGGVKGTTHDIGTETIDGCYIANMPFSDSTGSGICVGETYYKN